MVNNITHIVCGYFSRFACAVNQLSKQNSDCHKVVAGNAKTKATLRP